MASITEYLDIDEVFDLSLCCHHFQYLAKAPHTVEAQEAQKTGHFSRALRRVAKRRRALSQASPYVLGIVGLADSYEYIHGILCYIIEARPRRWLRILDLRRSSSHELVIDIPTLVREAVPRSAKSRKYKFRVLYHANGITSCLFSFALPNMENWLLIFNAEEQKLLATVPLESTAKIFVRNNKEYLYFGTHSEEGADGYKKWVLTGFRIQDRFWFPRKFHLTSLVGYDVGSTVCFEIIDDYFYGLSNQTDFEIRETDWVSYYHCFRLPLGEPDPKKIQTMDKEDSWRRQHAEGPIDDRWGFLKLEKDEASGEVNIIESRKEWLSGQSGSRRSYYITEVVFRPELEVNGDDSSQAADPRSANILNTLNKPNTTDIRPRSPKNVHPGDDSSVMSMFTRSQTHLRSYQQSCNTYLDLVDDASSGSPNSRRLRLRAGHRKRKPNLFTGVIPTFNSGLKFDEQPKQIYQPNEIYYWPPEQEQHNRNLFLDRVYRILNPPDYLGGVTATSDERSLIYATGEDTNGLKVLIYLSFDPAARLAGMLREGYILGEQEVPRLHTKELEEGTGGITPASGGFSQRPLPSYISNSPSIHTIIPPPKGGASWAWVEKAMYQDLSGKFFTFAL
ncbi:hypothetical protein AAE478_006650 [Parahypoxylon ruwenzoriense]